jgi:uncharacterized tellurite resistance protein B-like protein
MFFKRAPKPVVRSSVDVLRELVQAELRLDRDADEDEGAASIVVAVAGLLAAVAYADRVYGEAEQAYTRDALSRLDGLTDSGVTAICQVLRDARTGRQIAAQNPQAFTRELRERTDVELRREVLTVLVDLAAVDGELSLAETDLLRRTASALGLTTDDYLHAQAQHRDKLTLLKSQLSTS